MIVSVVVDDPPLVFWPTIDCAPGEVVEAAGQLYVLDVNDGAVETVSPACVQPAVETSG